MNIESTIVTALSTLFGVALTLYFTNRREESKFIKELKLKDYDDMKSFYVELLASIEKVKTYTENGKDYEELFNENSLISAKANLIAPEEINEKLGQVSQTLYEWSALYQRSLPTKIAGVGSIVSTEQGDYRKKANELYPKLFGEIGDLVIAVKVELRNLKSELKNPSR